MPRRPFSLSAYLALARGRDRPHVKADWPDRPDGPLLWVHADDVTRCKTAVTIARRLQVQRPDLSLLVTCDAVNARWEIDEIAVFPPPPENIGECLQFLEHWLPDVAFWAGNGMRPALVHEARKRGCRLILADARDATWRQPAFKWLPDAAAGALGLFDTIFATGEAAARRLRRLGVPAQIIQQAGELEPEITPLPCSAGLHEEVAGALAGRPTWLAAHVEIQEADTVLRAHRRAARLAHRLMLVLVPQQPEHEERIAEMAQEIGLRTVRWDNGDMPEDNTDVLLARDCSDLGLWYRVAPLSFLGGSLRSGIGGHSPLMAAALGSAVLYGPNVGQYLAEYSRLVEAGAARIVKDIDSLSTAITQLIAPDQAAAMACAGWEVVSAGADTANRVIGALAQGLDDAEAA